MSEDSFYRAGCLERSSSIVIVAISLLALILAYSGALRIVAGTMNAGESMVVIAFAVALNIGLVGYQVHVGKGINKLCNRPYL